MAPNPRASTTITLLFARDRAAGAMRRAAYHRVFTRVGLAVVGTRPTAATAATGGRH